MLLPLHQEAHEADGEADHPEQQHLQALPSGGEARRLQGLLARSDRGYHGQELGRWAEYDVSDGSSGDGLLLKAVMAMDSWERQVSLHRESA